MNKELCLKELRDKKIRIENIYSKLGEKSSKIQDEIDKYVEEIIIDKKYLLKEEWKLLLNNSKKNFSLYSKIIYRKNKIDTFKEILELSPGWEHHTIRFHNLYPGTSLNFDDSDVYLYFDDPKSGFKFIKENNLKVDLGNLEKEIFDMKNTIITMDNIVKLFQGE